MLELYAKGTTNFARHGIALAASKASVTWQASGRYDMDMTMPYNALISIDYGMIIRCPVPAQEIGPITLGTVEYWEVTAGLTGVKLYKSLPYTRKVSYSNWQELRSYMAGDKVTYGEKNWQCTTGHGGLRTPPPQNPNLWDEISGTELVDGQVITTLQGGDALVKTGDYNSTYMKAADTAGHEGFIRIDKCTDLSETDTRVVPAMSIRKQSFTITEITKSSDGKMLSIHAEHISYALGRVMLGECSISRANPATAVLFIRGAMKESYPGEIETNITGVTVTGDFSWKNAQSAFLDPKSGFTAATNGTVIRNDWDVYIIAEGEADPRYRITYGTNLKAVKWDGDISSLVTRVYPIAQREDGSTLLLPEEYIDSVRTVPYIRPEALKTGLRIGQKEKQEDGTEIELDENTVYQRMREAANNRFSIDECDKATITLDVDWQHLPDTAEYAQYAALMNAAPGEWVEVRNAPLGISAVIQMTGYTYDPILMRYQKGTFGKKKVQSTVAGYEIQSGAVTSRAIGAGAVGSANLQQACITAREIEANSITSDRIASRSITTELLSAGAVTADEITAGSVTTEKLAAGAVTANKIAAHTITSDEIMAGTITSALIASGAITAEVIASGAITTDKLAAGAVEASKIAALAITTDKLAAGAITSDKIDAGAITAAKISADDISAINAKLHTATIYNGYISNADIDYARIKDAAIDQAIITTSITEQGIADRLYINRLLITYGQMVEATIGDLVIGASDGYYYHIDVEWDDDGVPAMVPTRVDTPSAAEIAAGHTTNGQTIVGGVGTFAELSSEDFYAINSIIDRITAKRIDVDQLWARQAFINKLNVQDLSSNTYIQSVVGNWQSQSTITQTVDGINSRITSLGYGTFFYSATEPDPTGVVVGDVWIEPIEDNTWNDISQYTWDDLSGMTWEQVAGQYRMYVWTGTEWKLLFDNMIISELQTQINQNAYAITLKANQSAVDTLSGQVTDFAATLEVQAQAITAAVSAVNAKAANYKRLTDPADDPDITLTTGDIWTKAAGDGTWNGLADYTWNELADLTWDELAGANTYVWTGSEWIQTGGYGTTIQNRTLIEQTQDRITLLAEEQLTTADQVYRNTAQISITAQQIAQEVSRATNAENGKIAKTSTLQTADQIVSEAVSQAASSASGLYMQKTTQYQTPQAIVNEAVSQAATAASGAYIAKTSTYQTADSIQSSAVAAAGAAAAAAYIAKTNDYTTVDAIINKATALASDAADTAKNASIAKTSTYQSAQAIVNTAVAQAATAAGQAYIAKTSTYQTADSIVSAAESYTNGQLTSYSTTTQTSSMISTYVANNAYGKVSGITITASGIDISGSQYVQIASGGYFRVTSGTFGIKSDAGSSEFAIWSGANTAASSPFRVKKDGTVYLTKLIALDEQNQESEVNLRTTGLWKLNYATIKTLTVDNGYCTSMTFSNAINQVQTVNFKTAASARAEGWSAAYSKVKWPQYQQTPGASITFQAPTGAETDHPNYAEREYTLLQDGQYIVLRTGGLVYARYFAYSKNPTWTHQMVTASVVSVSCTVDGYTYTTQFSV